MKTAISIPDEIFHRAEKLATAEGITRSELYVTALSEYITERDALRITERLDEVYTAHSSDLDPVLAHAQAASIPREEW